MALIPEDHNTTEYKLNIDDVESEEHSRDYFGMSYLGSNCTRFIQYSMRLAYERKLEARQNRIFEVGKYLEDMIYAELKRIGITVTDIQKELTGFAGHWKGHIDGIALGVIEAPKKKHLTEIKTHNNAMYKKLIKGGVKQEFLYQYKQLQRYMEAEKIDRGLYIGYNKDTSEIYVERIYPDKDMQRDLKAVEFDLIVQQELYPRIGNDSLSWWECRMCLAKDVCFNLKQPSVNCRTCKYSEIHDKGIWYCIQFNKELSFPAQLVACPRWDVIEMFKQPEK